MGVRYWLGLQSPVIHRPAGGDYLHALCGAQVARRLKTAGWAVEREVEVGGDRSRGWIDLLAYDPLDRSMLTIEIKTETHDLGAIERSLNWYQREAWAAARRFGWKPLRSGSALLVMRTTENDQSILASRAAFAAAFPGRAEQLRLAVARSVPLSSERALAMIDPRSRRSIWIRPTKADGRRSTAPYADYIDAVRQFESAAKPRRRMSVT
jgi:hypothetical protein